MNAAQLIEHLKQFPSDTMVIVRGYEGGVDEVDFVSKEKIDLNVNTEWYYGKHEITNDENGVNAVLIG